MRHAPRTQRTPRTSFALTATVAIVAAMLVGCGGSTSGVLELPPDEVLAVAAERSAGHDTARMRVRTVTSTPQGDDVTVTGEGVGGGDAARFTATMDGAAFGADGPVEVEMRLLGSTMYQRSALFSETLGTDATWISIDLAATIPGFETMLQQARQYDPSQALSQLRDLGRVSEIGPETVNGVSTKHYTAMTTMRASFEAAGIDDATMQQYVELAGIDLDADVPMEVWIDDRGLVRRTRVQVTTDTFATDTTTDILEYDVAVDVTPPPADQTVSIEDLQG